MTLTELSILCKQQRKAKGLTQKELAESIGIHQEQIARFEAGKENFGTKTLLLLLKELDLNISPKNITS